MNAEPSIHLGDGGRELESGEAASFVVSDVVVHRLSEQKHDSRLSRHFLAVFGLGLSLASCVINPEAPPAGMIMGAKDASISQMMGDGGAGPAGDAGDMACEAPRLQCGSLCINVLTDSNHCGGCNQVCTGGTYCNSGTCERTCPNGTVACGNSCVDLATDTDHCGACDMACASDRACLGGICNCQMGNIECAGSCINPNDDESNCGICGRMCETDEICNGGSCACSGGTRETNCTDGQDDDCDGNIDCADSDCIDVTRPCMGACGPGVETCEGMDQWSMCVGGNGGMEICGDGIDQDCMNGDLTMPDSYEPNDTCGECKTFTTMVDPENVTINARMDSIADNIDCFRFEADDGFSPFGPESIDVRLENIPMGTDFDLYLYQGLDACLLHSDPAQRSPLAYSDNAGSADESLSWSERFGTTDTGTYYIMVVRFRGQSCTEDYALTVNGLR
jgi:hypothetical protein